MIGLAFATALTGVAIIAPGASAATGCVTRTFGESNTYQQCVRDEQILLNDLFNVGIPFPNQRFTVDGIYGPRTFSDVVSFQSHSTLHVDGITGPQTWQLLCNITGRNAFRGVYWRDAGCPSVFVP